MSKLDDTLDALATLVDNAVTAAKNESASLLSAAQSAASTAEAKVTELEGFLDAAQAKADALMAKLAPPAPVAAVDPNAPVA